MRSYKSNDEGFTGLEAAIVLIAFVVVAAVFSYMVTGARFFMNRISYQPVQIDDGPQGSMLLVAMAGDVYGTRAYH
jgi:flagellin FlaB